MAFWLTIAWASLWKQEATFEEVPLQERNEWVSDTLEEVMIDMKHKHQTPQMMGYRILNLDQNNVLVEFPGLKGFEQEKLEAIITVLINAESIHGIGGAFIDGERLDLFG